MREQEPFRDNAEDAPGVVEPLRHLADHGHVRRDRRRQQAGRGPVPAPPELAQQGDGIVIAIDDWPEGPVPGDPPPAHACAGPEEPGLVHRAQTAAAHVVGEHASQEQRQVTQATEDARPFGIGDHVEQAGQADGVEL